MLKHHPAALATTELFNAIKSEIEATLSIHHDIAMRVNACGRDLVALSLQKQPSEKMPTCELWQDNVFFSLWSDPQGASCHKLQYGLHALALTQIPEFDLKAMAYTLALRDQIRPQVEHLPNIQINQDLHSVFDGYIDTRSADLKDDCLNIITTVASVYPVMIAMLESRGLILKRQRAHLRMIDT